MSIHPSSLTDVARLAVLRRADLLDSSAEAAFDRATRLAVRLLRAPTAFVSLVTPERHLFKSAIGLPEPWATRREMPLTHSICWHVVTAGEPLLVTDAREHPLLRESPARRELGIVAYAGIPLLAAGGHALGALAVVDHQRRRWTAEEISLLDDAAASVVAEIERRLALSEQAEALHRLRQMEAAQESLVAEAAGLRERLQMTLERMPIGCILNDAQFRFIYWNPAAERIFGYEFEEVRGLHPFGTITPAGSQPLVEECFRRVAEGDFSANATGLNRTKDGRTIVCEWINTPLRAADGSFIGILSMCQDVTGRKQTERGLRAIAARARCVLWYADVEDQGGERRVWDMKIADEEAAQRFFPIEIPPGVSFVQAAYDSRLPEDRERVDEYGDRHIQMGQSYSQEYRCRRADGEVRWMMEDVQVETVAPGHWHVVGVCMDITDRKQMEDALRRQTEELEEADRRKDQFLAMLAHELRNPLGSIRNAVEVLKRLDPLDSRQARALQIIDRQVRHQSLLLDDLLDVSRITRGKILLHRHPLDLSRLVRDTVEDCRDLLESAGLTLTVDTPPVPVPVVGDATRLAQVLGNLLNNAAKFTDAGGHVTVRCSVKGLRSSIAWLFGDGSPNTEQRAPLAMVTVEDTGIGIEPAMLPRVFDTFMQADCSLDRTSGGLGLGLALVKGLVELHGGQVQAESEGLGRGARFTVCLPLTENPQVVGPSTHRADAPVPLPL